MALEFDSTTIDTNPMQPVMPLLIDRAANACACVDPADADIALSRAQELGVTITKILVTHHHNDHTAGVVALKEATGAEVWGPSNEDVAIAGVDHQLKTGDWVSVGASRAMVYECPGHTRGHITFHFLEDSLFIAGDTLFTLGCGRLNEGTPADMWGYLSQLRELPGETRVLCGHNYTGGNFAFTRSLLGDSEALRIYEASLPALGMPAIMRDEQALNLFLRADDPKVAEALGLATGTDPVEVFAELRGRKDRF